MYAPRRAEDDEEQGAQIGARLQSICSETANMESEDSGGEWRRSGRKRCRPKNNDWSSDVPQQPKKQDNTSLTRRPGLQRSKPKVSEALEKLCQEYITQVRPNDRLNLIAVDISYGVIQGVDAEDEIARNLRTEDTCCKIANVRRLRRPRFVKSPANVRRPAAVVGNTMMGRVLNVSPRQ
ncbi:hypothetical protein HPB47_023817 [Ixodes persulcatus]|uniref:Uncharacterized protein n=1 Tax=Ixodes persulcatus TaxID=34615 RepID=A0AC60Q6E5_IXOPE|nr:hypothetical protein HPB47_023817 [Ixodes persulcatus]